MTSIPIRRAARLIPLLALLLAVPGCDRLKARITVREGNELFKAEKYERAIDKYEAALAQDPSLTKIYRNIGLAYMAMFQPASESPKDKVYADKAIEFLQKYIQAYPEDPKGPEYLVNMYLNASRFDEAISFFHASLQKNPDDLKTVQRLALVYQKKQDFENALKWRQEQARLSPSEQEKAEAWYTIGVLCWDRSYNYPDLQPDYRQQVIQRGLDALEQAQKHKPEYFEAVAYVNLLYREKAKFEIDPVKKAEYLELAKKFMMQAIEMRKAAAKKAAATAATAIPLEPPPPATAATPASAATTGTASPATTAAAPASAATAAK